MVVDASALVAILHDEPERMRFNLAIEGAATRALSAASFVETTMVIESRYGLRGKGRHPAGLNFGDCFSYALARAMAALLLFKVNDFSRTDIASAIDLR